MPGIVDGLVGLGLLQLPLPTLLVPMVLRLEAVAVGALAWTDSGTKIGRHCIHWNVLFGRLTDPVQYVLSE